MGQGTGSPRVLVIRGGAIGDFILTLPAIKLLRDSIPNAQIEILGYKTIIDLAVAGGIADTTRSLEHATMARWFAPKVPDDDPLREYFGGFNLIVSYLYDPDGIFRANLESAGVRTFIEASHQVEPGRGHASQQLARPLQRLAMFLDDPAPRLRMLPEPVVSQRTVALHPGSGSLRKNWPVENWTRLVRELQTKHTGARFALVTGEAEAERGITSVVVSAMGDIPFLHWDQMPLVRLASHLSACSAFLGHDSGIAHLAAAAGTPSFLLFGPTDPATWAPPHENVQVLCEPSGDLQRLPFETVVAAAGGWLAECLREK